MQQAVGRARELGSTLMGILAGKNAVKEPGQGIWPEVCWAGVRKVAKDIVSNLDLKQRSCFAKWGCACVSLGGWINLPVKCSHGWAEGQQLVNSTVNSCL